MVETLWRLGRILEVRPNKRDGIVKRVRLETKCACEWRTVGVEPTARLYCVILCVLPYSCWIGSRSECAKTLSREIQPGEYHRTVAYAAQL